MTGSQQGATLQCQADHTFSDLAIHATVSLAVSTCFIFLSLQFYPTLQTASHNSLSSQSQLCAVLQSLPQSNWILVSSPSTQWQTYEKYVKKLFHSLISCQIKHMWISSLAILF